MYLIFLVKCSQCSCSGVMILCFFLHIIRKQAFRKCRKYTPVLGNNINKMYVHGFFKLNRFSTSFTAPFVGDWLIYLFVIIISPKLNIYPLSSKSWKCLNPDIALEFKLCLNDYLSEGEPFDIFCLLVSKLGISVQYAVCGSSRKGMWNCEWSWARIFYIF